MTEWFPELGIAPGFLEKTIDLGIRPIISPPREACVPLPTR
jgi:hypothetical protein